MMRHLTWTRRRLRRSVRARLGALLLVLMSLPAIFADLIAATAPLVAVGGDGVELLPGVLHPQRYAGLDEVSAEAMHQDDWVLWAPLPHGPETPSAVGPNAEGSAAHPLGTDALGRDVAARVIHGGRTALVLALAAVLLAVIVGTALGGLAGYLGGFWDELLSRPIELVEAFPTVVVVAIAQALAPQASALTLVLAIAAVRWAEVARLVRVEVVRATTEDFLLGARAIGAGPARILWRHVLPVAVRPVIVSAMFGLASVVALEAALSFLGIGVAGSWGAMIAEGLDPRTRITVPVGAAIGLAWTVLASYLLADALGEAADARVATTSRGL